jgi:hypothetical protein
MLEFTVDNRNKGSVGVKAMDAELRQGGQGDILGQLAARRLLISLRCSQVILLSFLWCW